MRFLPVVEMTCYSELLGREGLGGGGAAPKPPPDYITACHSERSEESHYNIINETFFIGQQ